LYNRDAMRAIFLLSLSLYLIVLALVWLVTHFISYFYGLILLPPALLVWLYGMYDAYAHAKARASALPVGLPLA